MNNEQKIDDLYKSFIHHIQDVLDMAMCKSVDDWGFRGYLNTMMVVHAIHKLISSSDYNKRLVEDVLQRTIELHSDMFITRYKDGTAEIDDTNCMFCDEYGLYLNKEWFIKNIKF